MVQSGTNLERVKDYNAAIVLNLVRKQQPVSRRDISNITGLSFQTVINITDKLLESEIIQEGPEPIGTGVRQSRSLQINPNTAYAAGIHIDRRKLSFVLTNFSAQVLWRTQTELTVTQSFQSVLIFTEQAIEQAIKETDIPREKLLGIGVGVPGPLNVREGKLLEVPNLYQWGNLELQREMEAALRLRVVLDEDVTAIIMAEQWQSLSSDILNVIYLYIGIGIGIGIISDGHVLRGWKGNIGQIGHIQVNPDGPICHCGKKGCLEVYATARGILRDARIATLQADHLGEQNAKVNRPTTIHDLANSDTPIFRKIVEQAAEKIGTALSTSIALLDPELVLFGGETVHALGKPFIDGIVSQLPRCLMPTRPQPRYEISALGPDAGPIGAAVLVLHGVFAPSLQLLSLA
jgi:predicted NBD/HSP70 family sugar kinase